MSIKFTNNTAKGNFEMECQTLNRTIEYDDILSCRYHLVWVIKENNIEKYRIVWKNNVNEYQIFNICNEPTDVPFNFYMISKNKQIEIVKATKAGRNLKAAKFLKQFIHLALVVNNCIRFGYCKKPIDANYINGNSNNNSKEEVKMSRLEKVVEEVKKARIGNGRAWIFDDNGKIKDEVICGEVLELLDEFQDYEINVSDRYIENFLSRDDVKGYNTYNINAAVSNDLDYYVLETNETCIVIMKVHLFGDIRCGYSDYFALKFDSVFDFYSLDNWIQSKEINEQYTATIYLYQECYSVYDYKNSEDVGSHYECEVSDLLETLNKEKSNSND